MSKTLVAYFSASGTTAKERKDMNKTLVAYFRPAEQPPVLQKTWQASSRRSVRNPSCCPLYAADLDWMDKRWEESQ